ncbi:MAG TPA: HD domain-containing phosphohydrolase [Trueperaceae bacterium]
MIQKQGRVEGDGEEALRTLLGMLVRRDPETYHHTIRVAVLARALARELGLRGPEVERVYIGALLHDIGKLQVRADLLKTQRILDTQERAHVGEHARLGYALARSYPELQPYLDIIRDHHERVDGRGYPARKRGAALSLGARIVTVADAFEVMTSGRGYQPAKCRREALAELRRQAGKQFCEHCVRAACSLWAEPHHARPRDQRTEARDSMSAALVAMPL